MLSEKAVGIRGMRVCQGGGEAEKGEGRTEGYPDDYAEERDILRNEDMYVCVCVSPSW